MERVQEDFEINYHEDQDAFVYKRVKNCDIPGSMFNPATYDASNDKDYKKLKEDVKSFKLGKSKEVVNIDFD